MTRPIGQRGDEPAPGAGRLLPTVGLLCGVACLLPLAGVGLMTVGIDEAWNLLGYRDAARGVAAPLALGPPQTSLGLFALVHGTLFTLGLETPTIHRLAVYAGFLAALLALTLGLGRGRHRWLPAAAVLLVPGTLHLASVAYAEAYALLLVALVAAWWQRHLGRSLTLPAAAVLGVLAGLTLSTRLSTAGLVPALVAALLIEAGSRPARLRPALLASAVVMATAAGTYLACRVVLLAAFAPETAAHDVAEAAGGTAAMTHYQRVLTTFARGDGFVPFALAAAVSAWWLVRRLAGRPTPASVLPLVLFYWATLGLWTLKSPIPHLRYVWPALAALAVAAALMARATLAEARAADAWRPAVVAATTLLLGVGAQAVTLGLHLVHGDTDAVAWGYSGEMAADIYFDRGAAVADQRDVADYLAGRTAAGAVVAVAGVPHPLRLLAGGKVVAVGDLGPDGPADAGEVDLIVLGPAIGRYLGLPHAGVAWLADHARVEARFGRHTVYRPLTPLPDDPAVLTPVRQPKLGHPPGRPDPADPAGPVPGRP